MGWLEDSESDFVSLFKNTQQSIKVMLDGAENKNQSAGRNALFR